MRTYWRHLAGIKEGVVGREGAGEGAGDCFKEKNNGNQHIRGCLDIP